MRGVIGKAEPLRYLLLRAMTLKKSNKEFIADARTIHGRQYDYGITEYLKSSWPVNVLCREHGPFRILPTNHLRGQGCKVCGAAKQRATATKPFSEFVRQAREVHGSRYRYDISSYCNARTKMRILCPTHGAFSQPPEVHLRPTSCPKCATTERARKSRFSIQDFRKHLAKKHGNRLVYRGEKWLGLHVRIRATCSIHGQFNALPTALLYQRHGCPKCAVERRGRGKRLTKSEVIARLKRAFGNAYAYGDISYAGSTAPITLVCRQHGPFKKAAERLFAGHGCPRCAYAQATPKRIAALRGRMKSGHEARTAAFLDAARERHGNRYDYSKVEFTTQRASIVIGCPIHGDIKQVAMTHLRAGCRACADADLKGRYSVAYFRRHPDERRILATLYYVRICSPGEQFFKVGITKTSIAARFGHLKGLGGAVTLLASRVATLWKAFRLEQDILRTHAARCPFRPKLREAKRGSVVGATECFSRPIRRYERYFGMR